MQSISVILPVSVHSAQLENIKFPLSDLLFQHLSAFQGSKAAVMHLKVWGRAYSPLLSRALEQQWSLGFQIT